MNTVSLKDKLAYRLWFLKHAVTSKGFFSKFIFRAAMYLLLFDLAFVFLFPFLYMIVTSVKNSEDLLDITVNWLPNVLYWNNYKVAFTTIGYQSFLTNSIIVTAATTIGHIVSCSFSAYAFARYRFPFRNALFMLVVLSMIVPVQTLIFPLYIMFAKLSWLNTYLPLIVPTFLGFGLRGGLFMFLFRQFFLGLPYELEEAARIDGCGPFMTFFRIVLPVSRSSILVTAVLSMVWHWNDYFEPNIYLTRPTLGMLPSRLPAIYTMLNNEELMGDDFIMNAAVVMAATFIVVLPILIIYMFLQKKFVEGIEHTGLTGM